MRAANTHTHTISVIHATVQIHLQFEIDSFILCLEFVIYIQIGRSSFLMKNPFPNKSTNQLLFITYILLLNLPLRIIE